MRARLTSVVVAASVLCLTSAFVLGGPRLHAAQGQYVAMGDIPIGGAGSWDYTYVDSAGKRLYQSHGTEVVVIDLTTNTVVGRIANTPGVHGFVVAPGTGRGFSSNGRENKVGVVDLKTLATIMKVDTGANPDAIMYEPTRKEVYALNHTGKSATTIDALTGAVQPRGDRRLSHAQRSCRLAVRKSDDVDRHERVTEIVGQL